MRHKIQTAAALAGMLVLAMLLLPAQVFADDTAAAETQSMETTEVTEVTETAEPTALSQIQTAIDDILTRYLGTLQITTEEINAAVEAMDADTYWSALTEVDELENSGLFEELTETEAQSLVDTNGVFSDFASALYARRANDDSISLLAAKTVTPIEGISVTDSIGNGTLSNGTVTITAKGGFLSTTTNTITIKNTLSTTAEISFDYSVSNQNSFTVAGSSATNGTYKETMAAGATVELKLVSKGMYATATLTLKNFSSVERTTTYDVTLSYDTNLGTVQKDGTAASPGTINIAAAVLTAVPNSDALFLGWVAPSSVDPSSYEIKSTENPLTFAPEGNTSLMAVFAGNSTTETNTAWFMVDGKYLTSNLNYASSDLGKRIVLMNNGTLSQGTYNIESGDELLIPYNASDTGDFDANPTMRNPGTTNSINGYPNDPIYDRTGETLIGKYYGDQGDVDDLLKNSGGKDVFAKGMYAYRTLTVPANTTINVAGSLNVNSRVFAFGHHETGTPASTHGQIKLAASTSVINVTGTLYCYGFITGAGTVYNNNTVYELFQIRDWRGLTAVTQWGSSKNFMFSQYYVQNIECNYIIYPGKLSKVVISLAYTHKLEQMEVTFVGSTQTRGFFTLSSGKLTRHYDHATERIIYSVDSHNGTAAALSLDSVLLTCNGVDIDSADYIFPLQNSTRININSGTTTINNDIKLLPNVEVTVARDAELVVAQGANLYLYDKNDWQITKDSIVPFYAIWQSESLQNYGDKTLLSGNNTCVYDNTGTKMMTTRYSPSRGLPSLSYTDGAEASAKLTVNGKLTIHGNVFTSEQTGAITHADKNGNSANFDPDTGVDANKIIFGSGTIVTNNQSTAAWGTSKLTETIQLNETKAANYHVPIATLPMVGKLVGVTDGSYNSFGLGTYHSRGDDYWYNYKVTSANADKITVTSTLAADGTAGDNVVGYVSYYTVDNTNSQSAFTFTVPGCYAVSANETELTPTGGVYSLTNVTDDTELVISEVAHNWNGNQCADCGVFKLYGTSLKLGESLDLILYVESKFIEDPTNCSAVITRTKAGEVDTASAKTISGSDWVKTGDYYRFVYDGIAAKEMSDEITVTICDADGKALSTPYTESIRYYAMRTLNYYNDNSVLCRALVDMLNYGAAAQTHFSYYTDALATAQLTDEQRELATASVSCTNTNRADLPYGVSCSASATAASTLRMNFYFDADISGKTITVSYTDHYGKSVSKTISALVKDQDNLWVFSEPGLAIADGRQLITCTIKDYASKNGNSDSTVTTSIEGYVYSILSDHITEGTIDETGLTDNEKVFVNLLKFVDSAYAYFHPSSTT